MVSSKEKVRRKKNASGSRKSSKKRNGKKTKSSLTKAKGRDAKIKPGKGKDKLRKKSNAKKKKRKTTKLDNSTLNFDSTSSSNNSKASSKKSTDSKNSTTRTRKDGSKSRRKEKSVEKPANKRVKNSTLKEVSDSNGQPYKPKNSNLAGKSKETERRLRANDREYNSQFKYADNYIKTSKYNLVTFIPVNLFEQFSRIANFYFLCLLILQLIPIISSIAWYSTALPLIIVLAFSAIKDGYDDVQRHVSDRKVNGRKSYVVKGGHLKEEEWSNVRVGDTIRMVSNQFVAADLLLISTSEPHGICYIETMELDGETNLKTRGALVDTAEMGDDLDAISNFNGEVACEPPNNKLDKFQGKLQWQGKELPITNENILLRGCILKNTRWCYGVVIFAGKDTKLMMNSGKTKLKRTSLDRFLNILILGIVLFLVAMCLICTILCGVWEWTTGRDFTIYLPWDSAIPNAQNRGSEQVAFISFLSFFSYVILLNTLVPISLYVSVEIIRLIHSLWINYDEKMCYSDGEKVVPAKAHTTTLNEELGQVQYIFSDKTGTLTRNIMAFNKATINGVSYGDVADAFGNPIDPAMARPIDFMWNQHFEPNFKFYDQKLLDTTRNGVFEVNEFWRLLSLCHTVMPERDKGQLVYQAQSPDEAALTSAARNFGYVFRARTPQSITIDAMGKEEVYELLCILDFNNDRKRMSVVTRNSEGKIRLYCKGADTMVMQRLNPSTSRLLIDATNTHLADFANIGLRTLCLAYRDIDQPFFEQWIKKQHEAAVSLDDREKKLDQVYEEMEKDMILLGATAIEDKLQEGVPDTIAHLAEANIKIWVLTGDKTETAINIAYSCRLLTDEMKEIVVIDGKTEEEVEVQLKHTKTTFERILDVPAATSPISSPPRVEIETIHDDDFNPHSYEHNLVNPTVVEEMERIPEGDGVSLVINGESLGYALTPRLEKTFLDVATMCMAVICCRVTPLQKALVVDLVKRNKKAVTLSIGDGANDVSMIKTAHIGVGISGQEGMQAVLASDYSIGQFKYLERLLLVHGRWSYIRMSKFLRYFFYKNFTLTLTMFWYSFFCGYSAMTVFDAIMIACYNLFFTALPVLAMGIFDQDVDDRYSMRYPKLYLPGQFNLFFNMRIFIYSVLHGMFSSLVIFFVPYGALYLATDYNGKDLNDYATLAYTTFTALIVVVSGQIAFDTL
ncbi:hypothetical protein WR25_25080 isoform B [Diploscapter pachys]|nr:hypothetical protein WR25_25080 isoform B [Diploscapter pachys]